MDAVPEIHLGSATYRMSGKMNIFVQFAVVSKISPLLASGIGEIAPLIVQLKREGLSMDELPMERLGQIITPVSKQLASMTEEDRRLIIGSCLGILTREDDIRKGWQPVWNKEAGISNFEDLNNELVLVLKLVLFVIQNTFSGFFPESLSISSQGAVH